MNVFDKVGNNFIQTKRTLYTKNSWALSDNMSDVFRDFLEAKGYSAEQYQWMAKGAKSKLNKEYLKANVKKRTIPKDVSDKIDMIVRQMKPLE